MVVELLGVEICWFAMVCDGLRWSATSFFVKDGSWITAKGRRLESSTRSRTKFKFEADASPSYTLDDVE